MGRNIQWGCPKLVDFPAKTFATAYCDVCLIALSSESTSGLCFATMTLDEFQQFEKD